MPLLSKGTNYSAKCYLLFNVYYCESSLKSLSISQESGWFIPMWRSLLILVHIVLYYIISTLFTSSYFIFLKHFTTDEFENNETASTSAANPPPVAMETSGKVPGFKLKGPKLTIPI